MYAEKTDYDDIEMSGRLRNILRRNGFESLEGLREYPVQVIIDDYMDYYNNRRYQWHLAKLSPNEFYKFVTTGEYPLDIPNVPAPPAIWKEPKEFGKTAVHIDYEK